MTTTPTPTDRAEEYKAQMMKRLSAALNLAKANVDHDDKDTRQTAQACRLLLVGAFTAPDITLVQAWTYAREHIAGCLRNAATPQGPRDLYRRILSLLDGK